MAAQICLEMRVDEMHAIYDDHNKVPSFLETH